MDPSEALERSWIVNAQGWTRAVREGSIASRRAATDAAVVDAVMRCRPGSVLDVGCGEGWLARALADRGVGVVGVDASGPLIDAAREAGGASYHLLSYAAITADPDALGGGYDAVVFNFALLHEDAAAVLRAVRRLLAPGGSLVIQTVHPWAARGGGRYEDGWREEGFAGFGTGFPAPMPWYFRTLASWTALLRESGYALRELREPPHPDSGEPLSLLLVGAPAR